MRPKKSKELIDQVAADLNLPKKTVEDVVNFYWKEVWETLTKAEHIKVHVTNLGDFNIKHWVLDKEIEKIKNFTNASKLRGANKFAFSVKMNEKLNLIHNLKVKIMEENQRKEFIKEHKKTVHETDKENIVPDMGEQISDYRGNF